MSNSTGTQSANVKNIIADISDGTVTLEDLWQIQDVVGRAISDQLGETREDNDDPYREHYF